MRRSLLEIEGFRPSPDGRPCPFEAFHEEGPHVMEGVFRLEGGTWRPVVDGAPCFLPPALRPDFSAFQKRHNLPPLPDVEARGAAEGQKRTTVTFSDKWRRFRQYGLEPEHREFLFGWYHKKLGLDSLEALQAFYRDRRLILEVGPGSGFNTRFMAENTEGQVVAADISEAARTTFENTRDLENCHAIMADLMDLPFEDETFDFVMADGVLHHTPDTRKAVEALYRKLRPGGQFFFYVYKQMGPARRFCDAHIRERFSKLTPEECYAACVGLTELGRELSRLGGNVHLEHGVPVLGIPPGAHDVQRLLYYNFVKCFWNEAFDFETNNMVNYDWYHPHHAWQHTEDEVAGWLRELGVSEFAFNPANPNGISVLLRKPG